MTEKILLIGKRLGELKELFEESNLPSYRGEQVFDWIYKRENFGFSEMTNLSLELRNKLEEKYSVDPLKVVKKQRSSDGSEKFLLELKDGETIETVFLPAAKNRNTLCVSSQVGCSFDCNFCATGQQGLTRDLTAGEIINQILTVQIEKKVKITNVVFMGMGEPLANYQAVVKAVKIINHDRGLNVSCRKIVVSTCGLADKIKKLARKGLPVTLAVSLHAAKNRLRNMLVPVNKRYPLEVLMEAADYYSEKTGRRVSYEYALIKGVNDSKTQARELADLLAGRLAHVNIIRINPTDKPGFERPDEEIITMFENELQKKGIEVSVRQPRGADITAACGQLKTES
jgi:23S rRNA (adenine2503-C2)-methyltransferase